MSNHALPVASQDVRSVPFHGALEYNVSGLIEFKDDIAVPQFLSDVAFDRPQFFQRFKPAIVDHSAGIELRATAGLSSVMSDYVVDVPRART
jgi:hypothetical protein